MNDLFASLSEELLHSISCSSERKLFVWKGILKNTPPSSKIHCRKNRNVLYLNRYRSNCECVRFLLKASPKLVRKQGKVYLSSKHKRRGYLGGVRYQSRV